MDWRTENRRAKATVVLLLMLMLMFGMALSARPNDPISLSRKALLTVAAGLSPEDLTNARIEPSAWRDAWDRAQADLLPDQWDVLTRAIDQAQKQLSEATNAVDRPNDGRQWQTEEAAASALQSAASELKQFVTQVRQRIVSELDPACQQRISDVQHARLRGLPPEFGPLRLSEAEARQLKQDLRHERRQLSDDEQVDAGVASRLDAQRARCVPAEPNELRRARLSEFETWFAERLQGGR